MPVSLYLSPAASGKTAYLISQARHLTQNLAVTPRVVVPTQLQVRAWRRRLAEADGALGVYVETFADLYRDILSTAGEAYIRLTDPIQYRLMRTLITGADLHHYAPLRTMPGFVQVTLDLIRELKAGGVSPEVFADAVTEMGGEPRLVELAQLYQTYQEHLQARDWADSAGLGWLAAEALEQHPDLVRDWPVLFVDGFDDLTTVQRRVLRGLADRVADLVITLTGVAAGSERSTVHKRFNRTRVALEQELHVTAQPLPAIPMPVRSPALLHLEAALLGGASPVAPAADAITLIAAPDRESEIRAALRWLKKRIVSDKLNLNDVALLARDIVSYRPFVVQVAKEFGLSVHVVDGLPLRGNPVVATLLNLLRLALPGEMTFPWRLTVEVWRSPYLDWQTCCVDGSPLVITHQDAETLDQVARWGSVVGGLSQWQDAFDLLISMVSQEEPGSRSSPSNLPTGAVAQILYEKFTRFVQRVTPPDGVRPCRVFVAWLEDIIGDFEVMAEDGPGADLGVLHRIYSGPPELAERDWAALNAFKDALRGLVWAEEAVGCAPGTFTEFFTDLLGAVSTAVYSLPLPANAETLLVANVIQARGLPFRAVALLGLAEGEFPTTLAEDPLLRDADRERLREQFGLELRISTDSTEAEYFYEAVTRPRDALLLTRPRLADNGALWQASPYWEEVRRRITVLPVTLTSGQYPLPEDAASWSEFLLSVATHVADLAVPDWAEDFIVTRLEALDAAAAVVRQRSGSRPGTMTDHDGDLTQWTALFSQSFDADYSWSASRLESYRTCPYLFFVSSVLKLAPRTSPVEGVDARQLGNIYHHIFEKLYQTVGQGADLGALQAALPDIAEEILNNAPREEQFRATAWWHQTCQEILMNVNRSLVELESLNDEFGFYQAEQTFGIPRRIGAPLVVCDDNDDSFRVRGLIDRVDRDADGRVRIIDYKTGGPSSYTNSAFREGEKLQLPLYALAAERALGLGSVVEGFYWHVRHAEPSKFTLSKFDGGVHGAVEAAVHYAWEAVHGARVGCFTPVPPARGCPDYCPAAAFCWHYQSRGW